MWQCPKCGKEFMKEDQSRDRGILVSCQYKTETNLKPRWITLARFIS